MNQPSFEARLKNAWESQHGGGYGNCTASSRFMAGKLVGLFGNGKKLNNFWSSKWVKACKQFDAANKRNRLTQNDSKVLNKIIADYPDSYPAYRAEKRLTGSHYNWKLAGKGGEIHGLWHYHRMIGTFNKIVLGACVSNPTTDVNGFRKLNQYTYAPNGQPKFKLDFHAHKDNTAAIMDEIEQLLQKGVPIYTGVLLGGYDDHWVVMVRDKSKPAADSTTWILDPWGRNSKEGIYEFFTGPLHSKVKADDGTRLMREGAKYAGFGYYSVGNALSMT